MTILWINLTVVFLCGFFSRYAATPALTSGYVPIRPNKILIFTTMVVLIIVSGLRNNIGDTYYYMHAFSINNFSWEFIQENKDFGFNIFQMYLKKLSPDPQILIFTTALITNILIVFVFYQYSRLIELSLYVYITGGLFLVSMNGIRQFLAAAIIFTATKFIISGNFKMYTLIVLLASTMHQSALVLIPIYFLVRQKAWSWSSILLLISSVFIVIGFNEFSSLLFSAMESTQYGHYSNFSEGGANMLRVAVNAAPLILVYIGREKMREIFPDSNIIVNLSLIGLMFTAISTQNWIFARFNIYFELYSLILISWIPKLFTEKDGKVIYYAVLIFYLLYYYYESVLSLNIIYKSNFMSI